MRPHTKRWLVATAVTFVPLIAANILIDGWVPAYLGALVTGLWFGRIWGSSAREKLLEDTFGKDWLDELAAGHAMHKVAIAAEKLGAQLEEAHEKLAEEVPPKSEGHMDRVRKAPMN